jgi:hypothetical protein
LGVGREEPEQVRDSDALSTRTPGDPKNFRLEKAVFTPGSRSSGGFAASTPELLGAVSEKLGGGAIRELGRGQFGDGQVSTPPKVGAEPGDELLTVRVSRYGLGFVARGPIYERR